MSKYMLAIFILVYMALSVQASVQVGCLTATKRVLRDEPLPISKQVNLFAAKNECRSFQIFVRSTSPVRITSLEVSNLGGRSKNVVDTSNAKLYREHQLHVTQPTIRNTNFKEGWYPDALIPFVNPNNGKALSGGRFTAVPFDLPANETHGFWIDIFVPKATVAGDYKGKATIKIEGNYPITIPIKLSVWDFKLPDTPTFITTFGSPRPSLRRYYAELEKLKGPSAAINWDVIDPQLGNLLSENKITSNPNYVVAPVLQPDGSFAIPAEQINGLRQYIDKYHLNLYLVSHPKDVIKDPESEKDKLLAWLKAWDKAAAELNRPQVTYVLYIIDEPRDKEDYKFVRTWGRIIKEANSVIKVMLTEQPKPQNSAFGDLYGSIDIWCPLFSLFDGPIEAQRQALGETVWVYTALCQGKPTPWWVTDQPLINYRAPVWISWRYSIKGLLYWAINSWPAGVDIWTEPITLNRSNRENAEVYNGEGSLLYPGHDIGFEGLAASIRLKVYRDSVNDYEYMHILENRGQKAEAMKIVESLAPSWFKWETDPEAYEKARIALAKLIIKQK